MTTTVKVSESKKKISNFRDLRWESTNSPSNKKVKTFWQVRTNFRKSTFIEYMKMKVIFDTLAEDELQMLYDFPGVLEDEVFVAILRSKQNGISLETLEAKLQILFRLGLTKSEINRNLYYTLEGTVAYQIFFTTQAIGKIKKFSGYVRNSSSVGSKKGSKTHQDPEAFTWLIVVEYDYLAFFNSVGDLSLGAPGGLIFTLTSPLRTKRKPIKTKNKK